MTALEPAYVAAIAVAVVAFAYIVLELAWVMFARRRWEAAVEARELEYWRRAEHARPEDRSLIYHQVHAEYRPRVVKWARRMRR